MTCKFYDQIKLVKQALLDSASDTERFDDLLEHCSSDSYTESMLIAYAHLLPEVNKQTLCNRTQKQIIIGYLLNEDIVFYNDLDTVICNYLQSHGALVIPFKIGDFCFKASQTGIDIHINDKPCVFDAFLSYGYRTKTSMDVYLYISKIMQENSIVCLHDSYADLVLNDKLLQSVHFAKSKIPIPDTYQTFDIKSTKALIKRVPDIVPCIGKKLSDYAGDGVVRLEHMFNLVNTVSKSIWKGENMLLQAFIDDSIGRSIRVLCFNNKAFSIIEYNSGESGDFRSNYYDEKAKSKSLMNHEKFDIYKDIAEAAIRSICDEMTVAGVDLIDSERHGILVIEINSWPELFESWQISGLNTCEYFAKAFIEKVEKKLILSCGHQDKSNSI